MEGIILGIMNYNDFYVSKLLTWVATKANTNKQEDKIILAKLDEFKVSTQC